MTIRYDYPNGASITLVPTESGDALNVDARDPAGILVSQTILKSTSFEQAAGIFETSRAHCGLTATGGEIKVLLVSAVDIFYAD